MEFESKIIYKILSITICLLFFSVNTTLSKSVLSDQNLIRIAILKDADSFVLSIRGKYNIVNPKTHQIIKQGKALKPSMVGSRKQGLTIGKQLFSYRHIQIQPQKDITIITKDRKKRRYRGSIDILGDEQNNLLVINSLDLETYVKGVLFHEVSNKWPLEAMKAQAVATRTYALYQQKSNKSRKYDITSDIYSQVYGGRSAERYRTNLAVNQTQNKILMYKGKILPTYFHASCGGHTENVSELWNHDLPPLRGIRCLYCETEPHYKWKKNFQLKMVQDKLNAHGYKIGLIKEIKIISRTNSKRIKNMVIILRDGKKFTISGKKFRSIIGPNNLKSNSYKIVMKGYYVDFIGGGWGHGVGMCQWGVHAMSRQRYSYKEILKNYYPGAKLVIIQLNI